MENIKGLIEEKLNSHLKSFNVQNEVVLAPIPKQLSHLGDYSFVVNSVEPANPLSLALNLLGLKQRTIKSGEKITGTLPIDLISEAHIFTRGERKPPLVYINLMVLPNLKQEHQNSMLRSLIEQVSLDNFAKSEKHKGKVAVVEHTSANPISPLHVGNLRCTIQGDTFARVLKRIGFTVFRHFYVNDGGLQIAFTAFGYKVLKSKNIKPAIKFDAWIGQIYAIMNLFYHTQLAIKGIFPGTKKIYSLTKQDITNNGQKLKNQVAEINSSVTKLTQEKEKFEQVVPYPKIQIKNLEQQKAILQSKKLHKEKFHANLQKYYSTFDSLKFRFPNIFQILYKEVQNIDLNLEVGKLLAEYEKGSNLEIKKHFREMVEWALEGFKWTLNRYNVQFDAFDFETDITWSKSPEKIVKKLEKFDNIVKTNGSGVRLLYSSKRMKELRKDLKRMPLIAKQKTPDLQLTREDGTSLYTTKDIAYSIYKFETRAADVVYNVVGSEQGISQFQLLLPLYQLGYKTYATSMYHYSYEQVELVGEVMSGRLALYITADQFYDETLTRVKMAQKNTYKPDLKEKRSQKELDDTKKNLNNIAVACVRFPLVESSPSKQIKLDTNRELDLKRNNGPFVLYAFVRAENILNKAFKRGHKVDYDVNLHSIIQDKFIMRIIEHVSSINSVLYLVVKLEDPSKISDWTIEIAKYFMKFYERYPVISAQGEKIKERLLLTKIMHHAIRSGLEILGIPVVKNL